MESSFNTLRDKTMHLIQNYNESENEEDSSENCTLNWLKLKSGLSLSIFTMIQASHCSSASCRLLPLTCTPPPCSGNIANGNITHGCSWCHGGRWCLMASILMICDKCCSLLIAAPEWGSNSERGYVGRGVLRIGQQAKCYTEMVMWCADNDFFSFSTRGKHVACAEVTSLNFVDIVTETE